MTLKMYNKITTVLLCVSLIVTPSFLFAQTSEDTDTAYKLDLRITSLDKGQSAPFTGILLTTDSLTKMQLEFEKKIATMEVDFLYKKKQHTLQVSMLEGKLEREILFRTSQLEMRDEYIRELESKHLDKDDLSPWWITASFVVGCLTTIAIAYSLQPAYN